ncbi:hypothetical protein GUITHDRAFT_102971 [Guillardia theta CCMP2712]|uniref:Myb-like domain-containing protein n=1 Tax=Guillardia theta (strain CCMP2712) TaxID=905079 RepID=L1JRG6_GUITC|nr:hypothetical protein GUITHDRAFT_102971 [Guillardia theta CCMP2712]EKX51047.1 hypothetical protein GUITHDRAFT_102971 [Guillardia theta CCMP2712]|eukprot:XP_005838027.1 hypothetical protein GUITHDRAFT_102971 [Guillardia theta CCMP2712]
MCHHIPLSPAHSVDDAVADLAMSSTGLLDSFVAYLRNEETLELSIDSADSMHQADSSQTTPHSHLLLLPAGLSYSDSQSSTEPIHMDEDVEGPCSYARSLLDSTVSSPSTHLSAPQSNSSCGSFSQHQPCPPPSDVYSQPRKSQDELKNYCRQLEKAIFNSSQWSPEEEAKFLEALAMFADTDRRVRPDGRRSVGLGMGVAGKISEYIGTRSEEQVRSHAQKHFLRQEGKGSR